MVTHRGQLMLTTAVIIAMVILGAAVLLTAAATTDVRSPDDPTTDIVEADRLAQDIERGGAGLAGQVNAMGPFDSEAVLQATLNDSFEAYGDLLFEAAGDRRATLLELDGGTVVQSGAYLADPNRSTALAGGDVVDPDTPAPLAALQLSLNVSDLDALPENSFQLRVHGPERTTAIAVTEQGGDVMLYRDTYDPAVVSEPTFDSPPTACAAGAFVGIDLTRGNQTASSCHVNPFDTLELDGDGLGLTVENPDGVAGGFHVAVGHATDRFVAAGYAEWPTDDEPFVSPIAWTVELSMSQWARASERHATVSVGVYDHPESAGYLEVPWE